jgi:hypothetical protein
MVQKVIRITGVAGLIFLIFSSCSVGLDPGATSDKNASALTVSLSAPASSSGSVSTASGNRKIVGGSYIYLQTGFSPTDAKLYGPYSADSSALFMASGIPSGTYPELYVIQSDVAKPDLSPIVVTDACPTFASALAGYAHDSWKGVSALAFASVRNVTVGGSKAGTLDAVLLPLTGETADLSVTGARYALAPSTTGFSRRFIRLSNIGVGLDPSLFVSKLSCVVTNFSAGTPESVGTVSLYAEDGSVIGTTSLSAAPLASGQSGSLLADFPTDNPRELFLYVEYQGADLALSFDVATVDGRTARFDYFVSDDAAKGSGATPQDPVGFSAAMAAIAANDAITADRPARILLTKDVSLGAASGYIITKPIKIVSATETPCAITFAHAIAGPYFTVGDASAGASGSLLLENVRISGGGSSRPGADALVRVDEGSLTMASGSELSDNATASLSGGAVSLTGDDALFTMNAGSIHDCSAPSAGAVSVAAGQFVMAGGSIYGCAASSGSGGAIALSGGSFAMSGGAIYGCSAYSGGAVFASAESAITLNGSAVIGRAGSPNKATALAGSGGGGIALARGASLTMSSGTVAYNESAALGGAVYAESGSTVALVGGSVAANAAALRGGAVYAEGSVTMGSSGSSSAVIGGKTLADGNTASLGGGVYVAPGGSLTVGPRSKIWYNAADALGGGVYVASGGTIDHTNAGEAAIAYNQAGKLAGGVFLAERATRVGPESWESSIKTNETIIDAVSSDILPDLARQRTVASQADLNAALRTAMEPPYVLLSASVSSLGTFHIEGPVAIGSTNAAISISPSGLNGPLFEVTSGKLILCDAITLTGLGPSVQRSYPLVVVSGGSLALCDQARIIRNHNRYGTVPGGGVYLDGGSIFLFGGSIGGDKAATGNTSGAGAGVYVARGNFSMYSGSVSHNRIVGEGPSGGAGVYSRFGSLYLAGGSIDHNDGGAADGGGILASGGLVKFSEGSSARVSANAARSGGGVCLKDAADFQMLGGIVGGDGSSDGNDAMGFGGGIFAGASGREFGITSGLVKGNAADGSGGGIAVVGADLSFAMGRSTKVSGNRAALSGGGLYFAKGSVSSCDVSDSIEIADNHVSKDSGLSCGAGVFIDSLPDVYAEFLNAQACLTGNTDATSILVVNITKIP